MATDLQAPAGKWLATIGTLLALASAHAAVAGASTALVGPAVFDRFDGQSVLYLADPGETNSVVITSSDSGVLITDVGATIAVGAGCTPVDAHEVRCPFTEDEQLEVELGDQNDSLSVSAFGFMAAYFGGDGNDTIRGGDFGLEYLSGNAGDDLLKGRDSYDILEGGAGADILSGGIADFVGDKVTDTVTYEHSLVPVKVLVNGVADDGAAGEGDNVLSDFEVVIGGSAGDVLEARGSIWVLGGGAGNDVLKGDAGGDILLGGSGADRLYGRHGRDDLRGDTGNDTLRGGGGADQLRGGFGRDWLAGGLGRDLLSGQGGADALLAHDGHYDLVRGGPGFDRAWIDLLLDNVGGVERVSAVGLPTRPVG